MKITKNIAFLLAAAVCLTSCSGAKPEESETEVIAYDKTEVSEAYNAEIEKYYSSLEDQRKKCVETAYFDIDRNGTDELILRTWDGGCDVYTYSEAGVTKCGAVYDSLYTSPFGKLVSIEYFGGGSEGCREYSLENGKITSKVLFSIDSQGNENLPKFEKDEEIKDYRTLQEEYTDRPVEFTKISEDTINKKTDNQEELTTAENSAF